MTRCRRIAVAALAPPLLCALIVAFCGRQAGTFGNWILGFPVFLGFSYLFGILPSAVYAGILELWFEKGYLRRYGLGMTVVVSGFVGAGAGLCVQVLSHWFTQSNEAGFLTVLGSVAGALIGLCLAKNVARE